MVMEKKISSYGKKYVTINPRTPKTKIGVPKTELETPKIELEVSKTEPKHQSSYGKKMLVMKRNMLQLNQKFILKLRSF
jgi:hypothetical protein